MPLIKNKSDIEETVSIYESLRQSYIENGYREYIFVKNDRLTNFLSVVYGLPFAALYTVIYSLVHRTIPDFGFYIFIISVVLLYITTPIHEALHGLGWSRFLKNGYKSIYIYLPKGISDAYCHCAEPLSFRQYGFGNIMPLIFLSIIPAIAAVLTSSAVLFYFSLFNAFGCGSDIANTILAFKNKDKIILDYPIECGFTAYKKEP